MRLEGFFHLLCLTCYCTDRAQVFWSSPRIYGAMKFRFSVPILYLKLKRCLWWYTHPHPSSNGTTNFLLSIECSSSSPGSDVSLAVVTDRSSVFLIPTLKNFKVLTNIVKSTQAMYLSLLRQELRSARPVSKSWVHLRPFIDEQDVVRVGGR